MRFTKKNNPIKNVKSVVRLPLLIFGYTRVYRLANASPATEDPECSQIVPQSGALDARRRGENPALPQLVAGVDLTMSGLLDRVIDHRLLRSIPCNLRLTSFWF